MRLSAEERRNRLVALLSASSTPISGSSLAKLLGVSRQVIVNDIALLRANRPEIISTPSGYTVIGALPSMRGFKVSHTDEQMEDELSIFVDAGAIVVDVYVEHRVYGTIRAPLNICSRRDVENFLRDIESGVSSPLKNLTSGYHFHSVAARSTKILDEIEHSLRERGYLIEVVSAPVVYEAKKYG